MEESKRNKTSSLDKYDLCYLMDLLQIEILFWKRTKIEIKPVKVDPNEHPHSTKGLGQSGKYFEHFSCKCIPKKY